MTSKTSRVLITGGTGYIAGALLKELAESGAEVFVTTRDTARRHQNISFISADLTRDNWTKHLPPIVFDHVIHLAQSREYRNFPAGNLDMMRVNVAATTELLEWCRNNCAKHFVFSSTGNVYDRTGEDSLSEATKCAPDSMYAISKYAAESISRLYQDFFRVTILRIFGVYGPRQTQTLIPNLINAVRTGKEIFLAGGQGLHLTPIYISDLVSIFMKLINLADYERCEIYNLAGPESISLREIVEMISSHFGKVLNLRLRPEKPAFFVADTKKIMNRLGLSKDDFMPFKDGFRHTMDEEKDNHAF